MRKIFVFLLPLLAAGLISCRSNQPAARQDEQQAQQLAREARELANKAEQRAQEAERKLEETRQRLAQRTAPAQQPAARDGAAPAQQNGAQAPQPQQQPAQPQQRQAQPQTRELAEQPQRPAAPRHIQVPAGVAFNVRLDQPLDTSKNKRGDTFTATLAQPIPVNGTVVIPQGTRFHGSVTTAEESGRLSGQGVLTVTLTSFELNGRTYRVDTSSITKKTGGHAKRNTGVIGGGAGLGAAIGGIAGGGKGAAIGAGAGAAAGTAGAALTGKLSVRLPAETMLNFTLENPVQVLS